MAAEKKPAQGVENLTQNEEELARLRRDIYRPDRIQKGKDYP